MTTLDHIGIEVSNLQQSLEFYTTVLHCERLYSHIEPDLQLEFIRSGNTVIELIYHPNADLTEKPMSGRIHLAFEVNCLDTAISTAKAAGVQNIRQPFEVMNKRITFFRGPDNEVIEFDQSLSKEQ